MVLLTDAQKIQWWDNLDMAVQSLKATQEGRSQECRIAVTALLVRYDMFGTKRLSSEAQEFGRLMFQVVKHADRYNDGINMGMHNTLVDLIENSALF